MLTNIEKRNIYNSTKSSNMRMLSRKYNNCKNTCVLPIQCTFNINPIFYKIEGNYDLTSNTNYNTIITLTEDATIYLYYAFTVYSTVASKNDPGVIIFSETALRQPGKYFAPAGSENIIIKLYLNLYNC
jgi:hypothetical protein